MKKPDAWKYGIDVYPLKDGYAVIADSADNGLECTWLDKELTSMPLSNSQIVDCLFWDTERYLSKTNPANSVEKARIL